MSTIDIRTEPTVEVTRLVFADRTYRTYGNTGTRQAHFIEPWAHGVNALKLSDGGEFVVVKGREHARNLIKALEKAIELGWLV